MSRSRFVQGGAAACLALLAFPLMACGGSPFSESAVEVDQAIVGGHAFRGVPAIGAILYDGTWGCVGTLIARREILTAAHCLLTEQDLPYAVGRMRFAIGPDARHPEVTIPVVAARPHPGFRGSAASPEAANDIAVLTLAWDAPMAPIALLRSMDQEWIGTRLLLVGYGTTGGGNGGGGVKRATWSPISSVAPMTFRYGSASHNTCWGDSGGPALYQDTNGRYFVAGTTSSGDTRCAIFATDSRVDTPTR